LSRWKKRCTRKREIKGREMQDIIKRLKPLLKDIEHWKMKYTSTDAVQGYFIFNELEMLRRQDLDELELVVYRNFEQDGNEYTGSMTVQIHPTMTDAEMTEKINFAFEGAAAVANPRYRLANLEDSEGREPELTESVLDSKRLEEWVGKIQEDILKAAGESVGLNATEILLSRKEYELINSQGLEKSWSGYDCMVELVTSCNGSKGEVELFDGIYFSDYRQDEFMKRVAEQVQRTLDRAEAGSLPEGLKIPVILSGANVAEFFSFFSGMAHARMIFEEISSYKLGKVVQESGDKISLVCSPYLPGSPRNTAVDNEGIVPRRVQALKNGVVQDICADLQFGSYLGLPLTGEVQNYEVQAGTMKPSDFLSQSHLEAVEFSDFQVNAVTGEFGGEIRLGYYFDGNERKAITGASVTGNIYTHLNSLRMSDEEMVHEYYRGPDFLYFEGLSISGSSV
jgi:predicted Zn-dependent protease